MPSPAKSWPAALLSVVLTALCSCSSELNNVRRGNLYDVPPGTRPQGSHPSLQTTHAAQLTPRHRWVLYSSLEGVQGSVDGDLDTAALTPAGAGNDLWLLIDLGETCRFQGVRQVHNPAAGAPARYRIDTAGPKGYPWSLRFVGRGGTRESVALFRSPVEARYVRITILAEDVPRWGVAELTLF